MKKILTVILLAVCTLSFSSCEKWLDVNNNVDAPDHIDGYLYLAGILSNYQGVYWDIRALGPLTQMMGTGSYTTFANHRYSTASDAGGETWRYVYWLHGVNLENMINQSIEAEQWTLAGIGYAIKAFDWDALTKINGEAPMKQAYEPGRLSFDYDYQDEIYLQVREWAKQAIEYLEMNDETNYGNHLKEYDLVYHGDKAKWLKFAHSVIVSNLASLTNKNDFTSQYAQELLTHAQAGIQTNADNFCVEVGGGADKAQFSSYNNFWGIWRGNLTYSYYPHQWAVQVMTGTVPKYDEVTGDMIRAVNDDGTFRDDYYPYELADVQIIADTTKVTGHFDPRVVCKISSTSPQAEYMWDLNDENVVKSYKYNGGNFTSYTSPLTGTSCGSFYGSYPGGWTQSQARLGTGKWLYRDEAPYVLMTAAEMKFMVAETYWKMNQKAEALAAWKQGVALDMEFTGTYLNPGSTLSTTAADGTVTYTRAGGVPGGVACTKAVYNKLAQEYIDGPYVNGMTLDKFTLSHIMMQKFVALYPWGAAEVWVDQRKYHYDIKYSGEVPSKGDGWTETTINQKWDTDPTKVYKGFFLMPAQVQGRRSAYSTDYNDGSPAYRIRPRYNSEYMWNLSSLQQLKPIAGDSKLYMTSMPWFAYPGEMKK